MRFSSLEEPMKKKFKVLGIGNAMIDILIMQTDEFLSKQNIKKGVMQLVDLQRAKDLYKNFGTATEVSGGSGANTIYGLASLGTTTCYIGKVKDDFLGNRFKSDLENMNIHYQTKLAKKDVQDETGRCIVFITPDGERSMNTYLGVTEYLHEDDIDSESIMQSEWIYLEGYRFDGPSSELAFAKAIKVAKKNSCKVALTLSDPFCVERNIIAFKKIISNDVDLLFCNEAELKLLYNTVDLNDAVRQSSNDVQLLVCTLAEKGAIVSERGNIFSIPTGKTNAIDTTGAGDLFAAGFLYGMTKKKNITICGQMGNLAASEIISHVGARPQENLRVIFDKQNFG